VRLVAINTSAEWVAEGCGGHRTHTAAKAAGAVEGATGYRRQGECATCWAAAAAAGVQQNLLSCVCRRVLQAGELMICMLLFHVEFTSLQGCEGDTGMGVLYTGMGVPYTGMGVLYTHQSWQYWSRRAHLQSSAGWAGWLLQCHPQNQLLSGEAEEGEEGSGVKMVMMMVMMTRRWEGPGHGAALHGT
jgi:hypothetical protein